MREGDELSGRVLSLPSCDASEERREGERELEVGEKREVVRIWLSAAVRAVAAKHDRRAGR